MILIKINYLINANYSVTEKADGERNFLYIDSVGKVYFINPRTTQRKLLYTNSKLGIKNSIIDSVWHKSFIYSINNKN